MTAKEYLRQAYRLNELIDSRITELERLRDYSTRLTSCGFEGERVSRSRNTEAPFARIIEKIIDLEKVINRDIDCYVDLKTEMNAAIDRVSNVDERLLLRYTGFIPLPCITSPCLFEGWHTLAQIVTVNMSIMVV